MLSFQLLFEWLLKYSNMLNQFFQPKNLEDKARFFAALGDPTTLKIIKTLFKNNMICVSDISKKTGNSVSAVSHQLAKLRSLGFVESKRDGKLICYSLKNNDKLKLLKQVL